MEFSGSSHSFCHRFLLFLLLVTLVLLLLYMVPSAFAQRITISPTTTLAKELANNTSASGSFQAQTNGNAAPANVSKSATNTLLYSGNTTRVFTHFMGWFGSSSHMNVGYVSNDPARVHSQVADMKSRGLAGAILDWYGPGTNMSNQTAALLRAESESQGFTFALTEDVGSVSSSAKNNLCDVTQKTIDDLNYAYTNYELSPAYLRINGRPVVFFFGIDAYSVDWNRVRAEVSGNPLFIFRNNGAFTQANSDGGFAWIEINRNNTYDINTAYLDSFYATALAHPTRIPFGTGYVGFNDTLAGWTGNRVMHRQCGRTWLNSFAEVKKYYNTTTQLPYSQIATWNDYDEGSEIESGIDNCMNVVAWTSAGVLYWKLQGEGTSSTVSYYRIFVSTDGQNLMRLKDVFTSTTSLVLSSWSFSTTTTYTFYVKAIGKPSIINRMSNPATYRRGNAAPVARLTLSRASGPAPLTITAKTSTSTDSDGTIASSKIDFGDGTVLSGPSATHTYQQFDKYTVRAYVYDNRGAMGTTSATMTVRPPTAGVFVTAPASGATVGNYFKISAYASSTLPVTSMKLYIDGKALYSINDDRFTTALHLPDGPHVIGVNAWDSSGAVQVKHASINVGIGPNSSPMPVLGLTSFSPDVGTTVRACSASSFDPDGGISRSVVDFGDGTAAQVGTTTYHTYKAPGTYTVKLTVTDDRGTSATTTSSVTAH
jgi:PKD repeat protein